MWFLKKKEQKNKLISETILVLNKLKRKRTTQESSEELNGIIKNFLEEKYNISQSLTTTELMKELKRKRIDKQKKLDFAAILLKIYEKEYKSKIPFTKKQRDELIEQTKKTIKN